MNKSRQKETVKIDFQIGEISNHLLRHLRVTNEAITHIYHALINFNDARFPPLQTDSLPIIINDPLTEFKPELTKDRTLIWLFKKAFEEFIIGLSESLIVAHKFSKLYCLSNLTSIKSLKNKEEFDAQYLKINRRPLKLPFPKLISEIEVDLNISIPLKSEILSINQVRNCLVHRNGLVTDEDINNIEHDCLELSYNEFAFLSEIDGNMTEVKWEHKKENLITNKIGFEIRQKTIRFQKGDKVILDQNIFNGVSYNCIAFTDELTSILTEIYKKN